MSFVLEKAGKFYSPWGWVGRIDQAQRFVSQDMADRAIADLAKSNPRLMDGAFVTQGPKSPEAPVGARLPDYDPFGFGARR